MKKQSVWRTRRIHSHDTDVSAAWHSLRFERRVACSQLLVVERVRAQIAGRTA